MRNGLVVMIAVLMTLAVPRAAAADSLSRPHLRPCRGLADLMSAPCRPPPEQLRLAGGAD